MSRAETRDEDFVVQIQPPQGDMFPVEILKSPAGAGFGNFQIPHQGLKRPDAGEVLFRALFEGRIRNLYHQSLGILSQKPRRLRIKLRINPAEPGLTEVADLPWESLTDPDSHKALSLSSDYSIVRDVVSSHCQLSEGFPTLLNILAVMPSPRGLPPLDLIKEREKIQEACAGRPVKVDFLEKPTQENLRQKLRELADKEVGAHILHFMGHGAWNESAGEGQIILEQEDGAPCPVGGRVIAELLSEFKTLRLVVLNSCNTAGGSFSSVASALLFYGFPAVLAMRSKISDRAAIKFSGAFYGRLANGASVEEAMREGRIAVQPSSCSEWKTPVLFLPTFIPPSSSLWIVAARAIVPACTLISLAVLHCPQPIVDIDLPNPAIVSSDFLVSGHARDSNFYYYLFIRDPSDRRCYVQNQEPLKPNQDGRWQALARFSGNPGQAFQIVAVASPRPLKRTESLNCGDSVPKVQSADRFVTLGGRR